MSDRHDIMIHGQSKPRHGSGGPMATRRMPEEGELRLGSVTLPAGKLITTYGSRDPVAWVTVDLVSEPGRIWAALSDAHQETGLVPFLLGSLLGHPARPWDTGEFVEPADPAHVDHINGADVLKQRWDGEMYEVDEPGEPEDPEFVEYIEAAIAPFSRRFPGLAPAVTQGPEPGQLREFLSSLAPARIGLVPAVRPADVLPLVGWTPSDQDSALPVAAVVRSWEDRFGAMLLEVGFAEIRLLVQRPPRRRAAIERVAAEHWAFADECDGIGRGSVADITAVLLDQPAVWQFWWD
jgi:hypothetical protein